MLDHIFALITQSPLKMTIHHEWIATPIEYNTLLSLNAIHATDLIRLLFQGEFCRCVSVAGNAQVP